MTRRKAKGCPTPWKVAYPSPQKAYRAAQAETNQEHYVCPGGGHWHLATTTTTRAHNMARSGKASMVTARYRRRKRRKLFPRRRPA